MGNIEHHLARNTVPECKAQAVCVNGRNCLDAGRCLRAGEVEVVPASQLRGAVEERDRLKKENRELRVRLKALQILDQADVVE